MPKKPGSKKKSFEEFERERREKQEKTRSIKRRIAERIDPQLAKFALTEAETKERQALQAKKERSLPERLRLEEYRQRRFLLNLPKRLLAKHPESLPRIARGVQGAATKFKGLHENSRQARKNFNALEEGNRMLAEAKTKRKELAEARLKKISALARDIASERTVSIKSLKRTLDQFEKRFAKGREEIKKLRQERAEIAAAPAPKGPERVKLLKVAEKELAKKDEQIKAAQERLKETERNAAQVNQQLARLRAELWLLGKEKLALRRMSGKRFFNTVLTLESEGVNTGKLRKIAAWNAKVEVSSKALNDLLRQQARLLRNRKQLRQDFYFYGK